MTLHLTTGSGGVLELHVHDGAHVTFSDSLEILPSGRPFEPRRLANPERLTEGFRPSRWLPPMAAGVFGIVAGFALSAKTIVPEVAPRSAAAMRLDPAPRPMLDHLTKATGHPRDPVPALPVQRAEEDGSVALPPAIARQLAQPTLVTPAPLPSAAPLKRNGNAFGLED